MNSNLAAIVDTVFLGAIDWLNRIEAKQPVSFGQVHDQLRRKVEEASSAAKARSIDPASWNLTHYALITWIDEMMIGTEWPGAASWNDNKLESLFLSSNDRAWKFYVSAGDAAKQGLNDVVEVYYLAVVLGFRGFYEVASPDEAVNNGLPPTIDEWLDDMGRRILSQQVKPTHQHMSQVINGTPALRGFDRFLMASLLSIPLILLLIGLYLLGPTS